MLGSSCSWAGRFESYLVTNPKDRFSRNIAQFIQFQIHCTDCSLQACSIQSTRNQRGKQSLSHVVLDLYRTVLGVEGQVSLQVWARARESQQNDLYTQPRLSLCICPIWSVFAVYFMGSLRQTVFRQTAKSDQTGQVPRLIWVFAGNAGHFVVLCYAL